MTNSATSTGGALRLSSGTVAKITDSVISANSANSSAGIMAFSSILTIERSAISDNTAFIIGAIQASGSITITESTINGNTATAGNVGGVYVTGGSLSMTNSTVSDNAAEGITSEQGAGGAIMLNNMADVHRDRCGRLRSPRRDRRWPGATQ